MNFSLSKKHIVLLLVVIILVGAFLRAYNFSDWLHFELDQARDARVIDAGLQGSFLDLPLLGPKAAGTALRLPPGSYYLEYLGSLIFGGEPAGQAGIILLFSIAAIPAAFLLFRRYFSDKLALSLSALLAISPFFVLTGRYVWNPNLLPFFLVFGFYALLRAVDSDEKRKTLWFALATFALVLTGHFHFVAFIGVPVIVALFLIWKRPRLPWRAWLASLGIIALLTLPMVLNDVAADWRNTEEFFLAIGDKSGKGEHALFEKIVRNTTEQITGYTVLLTGFEKAELPRLRLAPADIICDGGCRANLASGIVATVFYTLGVLFLVLRLWQTWKMPAGPRKDFLVLMIIWFVITWGLLMNVAYDLAPRFFLLVTPLPFLFFGLIVEACGQWTKLPMRFRSLVPMALVSFIALLAAALTYGRLHDLAIAHREPIVVEGPDRILKDQARVTLYQQNLIVDFIEAKYRQTGDPVYMHSESQHRRAIKYLMEKRGIENDVLSPSRVYEAGAYYLILRSTSNMEKAEEKYLVSFEETARHHFGTLTVLEFAPKPGVALLPRQDFSQPEKPSRDPKAAPRYTWREFFERREAGVAPDDQGE